MGQSLDPRLPAGAGVGRLAVVLGAALLVALATTSGRVAVPPSALVLVAAVISVALALVVAERHPLAAVAAAAGCGAAAAHLLARPGMPRVHDVVHLWGIWAYGRATLEGSPWPSWVPYLGAGTPLLEFYGPLNFFLALPGILAGLSPMGAWKLELFAGHVLAALSMLAGARLAGASWTGSLLGAAALSFAPWKLAVFGYRGALGEANAMIFAPLAAGAALRALGQPSRAARPLLAGSLCGLALTHVVTAFTLGVALVPVLAVRAPSLGRSAAARGVRALLLPCLLAAGLTAWWWVPVAFESRHTSLRLSTEDNPYYRYRELGVGPAELLERREWDRLRVALPAGERAARGLEGEQMPFYAGATLVLAGLLAPWWSRRRESAALAIGCLLALALATAPLARLADWVPALAHVRFPWRFLTPATVLAALAIALAAAQPEGPSRTRRLRLAVLAAWVGLIVWDGAPYTGAADRIPAYTGVVHWHTDDPDWVHWYGSMREAPLDTSALHGVNRVRNLELPPSSYATEIDAFFPAYYEWLTPEIYRRYWRSRDPATLARAGVSMSFAKSAADPVRLQARPYVTLEPQTGTPPVAVARWSRRPGRIVVEAEVPAGGARLVVLEQAFPGWRASTDGSAPAPVASAEGFLAVPLAAGPHRVELSYGAVTRPRRAGLAASWLTVAVGLGLAVFRRRPAGHWR